jgi:hypothetical protein
MNAHAAVSLRRFPHPWTIDDVAAASQDGNRYELVEDRLVVSRLPAPPHGIAVKRLMRILDAVAAFTWEAGPAINLRLGADLLIPDVMVAESRALCTPGRYVGPRDVLMVIEMISPANFTFARAWKPQRYAEGGIPYYLEVELPVPRVLVHALRGGRYERIAEARAGETLKLTEPFTLEFDPGELVGPRRSAGQEDADVGDARDQEPGDQAQ